MSDAQLRALRSDVQDMQQRIVRLGQRSERLEDALAASAKQNIVLLDLIDSLVDELEAEGVDVDIDLDSVHVGPEELPDDHTVDINFEQPHRSTWDGERKRR